MMLARTCLLGRATVWTALCLGVLAGWRPAAAIDRPVVAAAEGDVDAEVARLAPPRAVAMVTATREDAIASEMLLRSYSLNSHQAAGAAHALCVAARREGYDPLLFLAVISVESGFDHLARSQVGAEGLMQLMPQTAAALAREAKIAWAPHGSLDPVANVTLGVRYIAELNRRFHRHIDEALTAYNRGPANTRSILAAHGRLPAEVHAFYAGRVLARYEVLKSRYGRLR